VTAILEAKGLSKNFGAVTAAAGISAGIERDTVTGLIGTNGAGKTTFVNMITGHLKPDAGTIVFEGREITAMLPRRITRLGICRSFQIPQLYDSLTVFQNLMVGMSIVLRNARGGMFSRVPSTVPGFGLPAPDAAAALLAQFDLVRFRDRPAGELPEGIRKLLDIAMTMAAKPKVLLLDEPTSGVSAEEKFAIMDMVMEAVRAQGVTVLFVEHDMDIVARYAGRVLAFFDGRIISDGPPDVVLADAEVRKYVIGEAAPDRGKAAAHA